MAKKLTEIEKQLGPNSETLAHMYTSATDALKEVSENYHQVSEMAQSNLTISAIVLGLLVNTAFSSTAAIWDVVTKRGIAYAMIFLTFAGVISVLLPILTRMPTGHLKPRKFYEMYSTKPIAEIYKLQISNIAQTIEEFEKRNTWRAIALNGTRILIALAVVVSVVTLVNSAGLIVFWH